MLKDMLWPRYTFELFILGPALAFTMPTLVFHLALWFNLFDLRDLQIKYLRTLSCKESIVKILFFFFQNETLATCRTQMKCLGEVVNTLQSEMGVTNVTHDNIQQVIGE